MAVDTFESMIDMGLAVVMGFALLDYKTGEHNSRKDMDSMARSMEIGGNIPPNLETVVRYCH
ncbi:hypothetical protein [Ammoniphilus sp. YIM 78166]|uniref:hypothetical protein n=1 Tax=Ammoniphilus sp. YIM 78166 TaxID=1644106 RepID=UPI0010701E81|nr:hypothetical protein [Ammoniphilus sp. YIM 78166]